MDLSQALKAGIIPGTANPIDIILIAHKEGLQDILQKQILRHHNTMKNSVSPDEIRKKFRISCDFTEAELSSMTTDLKIWMINNDNETDNCIGESFNDMMEALYIGDTPKTLSSGILKTLRRKKIYKPVDDKTVNNCYKCGNVFDSYLSWIKSGKHHCRACGRIFCSSCSQWEEIVPEELISYIDIKGWIVPGKPARVCQSCKDTIVNFRRITPLVQYFEIVAYPIDSCIKASTISKDWREAIRFYLSNVRDIQYCLPCSKLTERDIRALNSNIKSIQGHSKWILQALKMGLITIDGRKIKMCHDMMCDRNCTEHLSPFDALIILNNPIYNIEVRLLALQILERDRLLRNDNLLEIPLNSPSNNSLHICDLMDNKPSFSRDIALFLPIEDLSVQEFVLKCPDLFLDFFWLSRIGDGISTDIFRNKLLLANHSEASYVQESLRLISMLDEHHGNLCKLSQQLQTLHVPFVGPFGLIEKFDTDITVKSSANRPVIIRYYANSEKRAFLYKREDLRKDAHIVALIRIMYYLCSDIFSHRPPSSGTGSSPINISLVSDDVQSWFTRNSPISSSPNYPSPLHKSSNFLSNTPPPPPDGFSVDLPPVLPNNQNLSNNGSFGHLVTYRVTPISIKDGFIEIVPHATTLYDILNEGTISNYLYNPDKGGDVGVIGSNYLNSLAFWTVISFILGVGDRHLENIMIRKDGTLFHIDYGFVFGSDTISSVIRLDHNLIEGLGGVKRYEPFKTRCCEIFCCLRRHFNLICSCLLRLSSIQPPIHGYNFTPEFIEKFAIERFLLGLTEEEAKDALSNIIDSNRETFFHKVSDALHKTVSSFKLHGWWS